MDTIYMYKGTDQFFFFFFFFFFYLCVFHWKRYLFLSLSLSLSLSTMEEEYSSPPLSKVNVDQNGKQLILPSGYMFSPLDSELVVHYLKKKILNQELPPHIIATIDVYSYDSPNQLPLSEFKYGLPNEWYFFTTRSPHNLFLTGNSGGWNELADETVVDNDQVVGYKRRLAFYFAEPLQEMKTDWFIHE
ncbi:hypothetical protein ACSBR1_040645 [Camellia fascicularis]